MKQLRSLPHLYALTAEVLQFSHPADAVLNAYFRKHPKIGRQDRQLLSETVFTLLRHWQKIRYALAPDTQPQQAAIAALLLGGNLTPAELETVLAGTSAAALLPILAGRLDEAQSRQAPLCCFSELPDSLIMLLRRNGMSETEIRTFGQAQQQPAPLDIRTNTLKIKRDALLERLNRQGLNAEALPYSPWGIRLSDKPAMQNNPLFTEGYFEIQDEGSQLLAFLTGARRNEIVVDFCSGAGGKALAMAAMMHNSGRLYAFDVSEKRLAQLKPRMQRAGIGNIHIRRIDSEQDPKLIPLTGKADRVLVDAPCSGLGTLRRNPDLKYRQSETAINRLCALQASILQAAAALVRPGGLLVYATCSILHEENEAQIAAFLQRHDDFSLSDTACRPLGLPNDGGFLRLDTARHGTDSFFAAVLQRQI